jgi:hypothetical protein
MREYGLDLSSYEEIKNRASESYARLADGSMPCDEPWSPQTRMEFFKLWMDEVLRAVSSAQAGRADRGQIARKYEFRAPIVWQHIIFFESLPLRSGPKGRTSIPLV